MPGRRAIRDLPSRGLLVALFVLASLLPRPARLAAKCAFPPIYCHVRQSVTTPVPAPIQRPPRFSSGIVAMGVESLTSTWVKAKGSLDGHNLDLYGAREQLGGYLALSFQRWLSLGASFEVALPKGELRPSPGPVGPPSGASRGWGLQVGFHFRLSTRLRLDWVSDLWLGGLRYRMRAQSTTGSQGWYDESHVCPPPDPATAHEFDATLSMFLFRSQLSLGVDLGRLRVVAALGLRNVPHHVTGGSVSWNDAFAEPREAHTFYPYLWLGIDLPLGRGSSFTVGLVQPLWADPLAWAPGLGIGIHTEVGAPVEGRP